VAPVLWGCMPNDTNSSARTVTFINSLSGSGDLQLPSYSNSFIPPWWGGALLTTVELPAVRGTLPHEFKIGERLRTFINSSEYRPPAEDGEYYFCSEWFEEMWQDFTCAGELTPGKFYEVIDLPRSEYDDLDLIAIYNDHNLKHWVNYRLFKRVVPRVLPSWF
jgi:hypothetical protein